MSNHVRRRLHAGRVASYAVSIAAALIVATATTAHADAVADFYRGKTMTFMVGAEEGGPYVTYARALIEHMQRRIPGKPNIIVQTMPGAGGVKMANYMFNVAPRDGLMVGSPLPAVPLTQVLRPKAVKFDAAKFQWIGNLSGSPPVMALSDRSPAKTLADARRVEVIVASSGKGSVTYQLPAMLNSLVGTKFKIVTGYKGGPDMDLAIARGEVHGRAFFYENLKVVMGDKVKAGTMFALVQVAMKAPDEIRRVPNVAESADTPEARAAFEFYALQAENGRAFFTPPAVPAERVKALRESFRQTTASPEFVAMMKARNLPFDVTDGEQVQEAVEKLVNTPKPIVERVRKIIGF
jgi:tripartite-type tricarboxylate transporter receptor subunit TctC